MSSPFPDFEATLLQLPTGIRISSPTSQGLTVNFVPGSRVSPFSTPPVASDLFTVNDQPMTQDTQDALARINEDMQNLLILASTYVSDPAQVDLTSTLLEIKGYLQDYKNLAVDQNPSAVTDAILSAINDYVARGLPPGSGELLDIGEQLTILAGCGWAELAQALEAMILNSLFS